MSSAFGSRYMGFMVCGHPSNANPNRMAISNPMKMHWWPSPNMRKQPVFWSWHIWFCLLLLLGMSLTDITWYHLFGKQGGYQRSSIKRIGLTWIDLKERHLKSSCFHHFHPSQNFTSIPMDPNGSPCQVSVLSQRFRAPCHCGKRPVSRTRATFSSGARSSQRRRLLTAVRSWFGGSGAWWGGWAWWIWSWDVDQILGSRSSSFSGSYLKKSGRSHFGSQSRAFGRPSQGPRAPRPQGPKALAPDHRVWWASPARSVPVAPEPSRWADPNWRDQRPGTIAMAAMGYVKISPARFIV